MSAGMLYVRFEFPRTDVTIDVEGTKVDIPSICTDMPILRRHSCNVMVSVSSAICREGDITLEGKRHHVVLLDYNSNGRFDDVSKISANIHLASRATLCRAGRYAVDRSQGRAKRLSIRPTIRTPAIIATPLRRWSRSTADGTI